MEFEILNTEQLKSWHHQLYKFHNAIGSTDRHVPLLESTEKIEDKEVMIYYLKRPQEYSPYRIGHLCYDMYVADKRPPEYFGYISNLFKVVEWLFLTAKFLIWCDLSVANTYYSDIEFFSVSMFLTILSMCFCIIVHIISVSGFLQCWATFNFVSVSKLYVYI